MLVFFLTTKILLCEESLARTGSSAVAQVNMGTNSSFALVYEVWCLDMHVQEEGDKLLKPSFPLLLTTKKEIKRELPALTIHGMSPQHILELFLKGH